MVDGLRAHGGLYSPAMAKISAQQLAELVPCPLEGVRRLADLGILASDVEGGCSRCPTFPLFVSWMRSRKLAFRSRPSPGAW
jgi:hypothetical protein